MSICIISKQTVPFVLFISHVQSHTGQWININHQTTQRWNQSEYENKNKGYHEYSGEYYVYSVNIILYYRRHPNCTWTWRLYSYQNIWSKTLSNALKYSRNVDFPDPMFPSTITMNCFLGLVCLPSHLWRSDGSSPVSISMPCCWIELGVGEVDL